MRLSGGIVVLLLTLRGAAPACAQAAPPPPSAGARLEYVLGPGAERCPNEEALRDLVATQMGGLDPFTAEGKRFAVTITRTGRTYRGDIALFDAEGKSAGVRTFEGAPSCSGLVRDLAISLTLFVRPFVLPQAEPTAPPPSSASPPVATPKPKVVPTAAPLPPEPPPSAMRPRVRIGVGPLVAFGTEPQVDIGFTGFVGVKWTLLSLALEARGGLPVGTGLLPRGAVASASLVAGSVVPCVHKSVFLGCVTVTAGALHGTVTNVHPASQSSVYVGTGLRGGLELSLTEYLKGQITGDFAVAVARPALILDGHQVWTAEPVNGLVALRLIASF